MRNTKPREPSAAMSTLPGAAILLRTRRLIVAALITAFVYNLVMVASRGKCAGGLDGEGGYLDSRGQATDVMPQCVDLTLRPSFWVFAAIALIVVLAITRVLKTADDLRSATRILDRAAMLIFAIAGASVLISYVWFFLIPLETWDGTGSLYFPFPFGSVDAVFRLMGS